jgi:hypothetical protein
MKRQLARTPAHADADADAKPRRRVTSGKYLLLYKYLDGRYANTVVLTFGEIEDLIGSALPDPARLREEWWTHPEPDATNPSYSDSWILASRTARPNLMALTVEFARDSTAFHTAAP